MSTEVPEGHPVLLFDGVCNLCNQSIQFVIERDPDAVFRFAPLQSDVGEELLEECGLPADHLDSVILVEGDEYYTKSDAALRTAKHLGGVYRLLWPLRVFPRRLRNFVYDFIANRRYRWFGKREQCMMPTPDIASRFLAGGPGPSAPTGDESEPTPVEDENEPAPTDDGGAPASAPDASEGSDSKTTDTDQTDGTAQS